MTNSTATLNGQNALNPIFRWQSDSHRTVSSGRKDKLNFKTISSRTTTDKASKYHINQANSCEVQLAAWPVFAAIGGCSHAWPSYGFYGEGAISRKKNAKPFLITWSMCAVRRKNAARPHIGTLPCPDYQVPFRMCSTDGSLWYL